MTPTPLDIIKARQLKAEGEALAAKKKRGPYRPPRNQPLKGNPELFKLRNTLEKEAKK